MVIVDTGFWLALVDKKDTYHEVAKQALKKYNEPLITTWCVITETCYLLLTRKGVKTQLAFINSLNQGLFTVFNLEPEHGLKIAQLMEKYADLPMDLADASLIILAEHLGHGRIFSVDQRDFNTYRWKENYPFENLLYK
ncbi:MAG: PIN domain-containing protein [Nostocales cyanobacterium 94392]|uniref:PIN domain-containing protein n=1 Tax=Plectonema cf. radiosum LEGE 06105 TaxID=945769 RepID=A0A8J7F4X3_9CYAN|nr:PIN domain-containing protein [Plectonema radiosum]MBE9216546.1 PIN domain-containing protein [Plectonema cf. radiosum LEGE 06105]MEB3215745.1 PIN domain-containing protein [Nostocales cyanobacterium 94392]